MTWITLLELVLATGKSLLSYIDPKLNAASQTLYDEFDAALGSLQAVHDKAVALADLETLRTKATW